MMFICSNLVAIITLKYKLKVYINNKFVKGVKKKNPLSVFLKSTHKVIIDIEGFCTAPCIWEVGVIKSSFVQLQWP